MAALPVAVLISGRGSNLRALIDARDSGELDLDFRGVVSNHPAAAGLEFAAEAGIDTFIVDHRDFASREDFDAELARTLDGLNAELIVLAGFMRILTDAFVNHHLGRMINLHPSLLPLFQGLDTHQRVLEAGHPQHGSSVHFVTPELDAGPVIMQTEIAVREDDTPDSLAQRLLPREHALLVRAMHWFVARRVRMRGDETLLDGRPLPSPPRLTENDELKMPEGFDV